MTIDKFKINTDFQQTIALPQGATIYTICFISGFLFLVVGYEKPDAKEKFMDVKLVLVMGFPAEVPEGAQHVCTLQTPSQQIYNLFELAE